MSCKVSGCRQQVFNNLYGLCYEHLQDKLKRANSRPLTATEVSLQRKAEARTPVSLVRTQKSERTQKDSVVHKKRGRPKKNNHCIKCSEPLSKHSASYCKNHEKERLKEWRRKRLNANIR